MSDLIFQGQSQQLLLPLGALVARWLCYSIISAWELASPAHYQPTEY